MIVDVCIVVALDTIEMHQLSAHAWYELPIFSSTESNPTFLIPLKSYPITSISYFLMNLLLCLDSTTSISCQTLPFSALSFLPRK